MQVVRLTDRPEAGAIPKNEGSFWEEWSANFEHGNLTDKPDAKHNFEQYLYSLN